MSAKRPNILLLMADQLAAPVLPFYAAPGFKAVRTPHLAQLAERSVIFDSAYCNFPICAPSRFSMLSGRLPHAIDAFDNASEFPSSIPTLAHYLRHAGYRTILSGKMHFIGADQLHGYEERLTTDIYPADFAWTPDWTQGPEHRPTGVSMRPVLESGACVRSMQIDYDDETEYKANQKLYDLARSPEQQPFFLTVSYTHPHPPFVAPQDFFNAYSDADIPTPTVGNIPFEKLDVHSQWLYIAHAQNLYTVTPEDVQRARRAYYAMTSYVDAKIGSVLRTLKETGLADNTVVVFCGDHGEMLGERGMWFKQTFFEWSVRVPLLLSYPKTYAPRRVKAHVSLVDLLPTFLDIADPEQKIAPIDPLDGKSLLPLADGCDEPTEREVISEYSSEGVCAASRMLRRGKYKYIYTHTLTPLLFDLETDPQERCNLAEQADMQSVRESMHQRLIADWPPEQTHARILASQKRRLFLAKVQQSSEEYSNWAYQPYTDESKRYIRGSGQAGPTNAKGKARFPFVPAAKADHEKDHR